MAEFHIHGSKAVIEAMSLCISKVDGCRLAEPGNLLKLLFLMEK